MFLKYDSYEKENVETITITSAIKSIEKDDTSDKREAAKLKKLMNTPYPYNAPEIVTEGAIPELYKFIIRQNIHLHSKPTMKIIYYNIIIFPNNQLKFLFF